MELIIHILMLFIVINCSFKLSFWKLWQTVIYSLIAGLFVAGTWQYAILQSKTQIICRTRKHCKTWLLS